MQTSPTKTKAENKTKTSSKQELLSFDVIVVGGGIVGLTMALLLAQQSQVQKPLKIALLDNQKKKASSKKSETGVKEFNPRVSALSLASQTLFASLNLWQEHIASKACAYQDMFVWDSNGTGNISFSALDIQQAALGHIVENSVIVEALEQALEGHTSISLIRGEAVESYEFENGLSQLSLNTGKKLSAKLVLAADGGNSTLRKQAEFKVKEWSYQHQAIVATVKTEKSHGFTASQCFLPTGPIAFLPLLDSTSAEGEQFYSSIVWSCESDQAEELMALEDAQFMQKLEQAFESKLGSLEDIGPRLSFPLWQRHATSYVKEGLALVGDAAHTIHPLAGQGVNLGLLDAVCLARVISQAINSKEDYGSERVLSRYQRERKGHNLSMMVLMEAFKKGFGSDDLIVRWLRNAGMSSVDKLSPIKHQLIKKAMGL